MHDPTHIFGLFALVHAETPIHYLGVKENSHSLRSMPLSCFGLGQFWDFCKRYILAPEAKARAFAEFRLAQALLRSGAQRCRNQNLAE